MAQNVGQMDRLARIGLGAAAGITSLGLLGNIVPGPVALSPVLGIIAIMLVGTGLTGFCGLYAALGMNTCSVNRS